MFPERPSKVMSFSRWNPCLERRAAASPIASLGLSAVMLSAKRIQLGSRPESDGASKFLTTRRPTV